MDELLVYAIAWLAQLRLDEVMSIPAADPIIAIAEGVAACIADSGYAFVEDDRIEELAEALSAFLRTAGIRVWFGESPPCP